MPHPQPTANRLGSSTTGHRTDERSGSRPPLAPERNILHALEWLLLRASVGCRWNETGRHIPSGPAYRSPRNRCLVIGVDVANQALQRFPHVAPGVDGKSPGSHRQKFQGVSLALAAVAIHAGGRMDVRD